jgi:hypothetical protein
MSVFRTILRHNAPTGEPLSAGNGGGTHEHEPANEPQQTTMIGHNTISDLRLLPHNAPALPVATARFITGTT